jgi:hypothetical protein
MPYKLKENLESYSQSIHQKKEDVNLRFDNPIAAGTSWGPMIGGGGSNWRNIKLKLTADNQLKVVKSIIHKALYLLLAGIGSLVMLWSPLMSGEALPIVFFLSFIGLAFFLMGFIPLYFTKRLNFDKSSGICYYGNTNPKNLYRTNPNIKQIKLDQIKGLQIISQLVEGSENGFFTSYELNLILENFERINVMNHSKLDAIRADAEKLSKYLEVPVFDATL